MLLTSFGAAYAGHVHTVNRISHGLGDGYDNDHELIPFNNYLDGIMAWSYVWLRKSQGAGNPDKTVAHDWCSNCGETYIWYDTNPSPECLFRSEHEAVSPDLNLHYHYHHGGWCG